MDDNLTNMTPVEIMGVSTVAEQSAGAVGNSSFPAMGVIVVLLLFSIATAGRISYTCDRAFFVKSSVVSMSVLIMSTAFLARADWNPEPWEVVAPLLLGCTTVVLVFLVAQSRRLV
jgi:hypothetical protein